MSYQLSVSIVLRRYTAGNHKQISDNSYPSLKSNTSYFGFRFFKI